MGARVRSGAHRVYIWPAMATWLRQGGGQHPPGAEVRGPGGGGSTPRHQSSRARGGGQHPPGAFDQVGVPPWQRAVATLRPRSQSAMKAFMSM